MLSFVLAASLWMPLKDWPAEATRLVERYGPPQTYTHHTMVWMQGDRTIEALRADDGEFMVVQSLRLKVPESKVESVLNLGDNVFYDGAAHEVRVWGPTEADASRLMEDVRSRLR